MRNNKPLVTILMTAYNAEAFVGKAIESILSQTYKNFEFVIVDDASTDNTAKIIRQYRRKDKRIKAYFLKKNVGPSVASNFGIKKAKGQHLARMDADDIAYSDRIEKQVRFLNRNKNVVIVGGQCDLVNADDEIVGEKKYPLSNRDIYDSLFRINPIQHPSCIVNLGKIEKSVIMGDNFGLLAHDLDLVFSLSRYGKLANLKSKVLYYRQTPNSLSLKHPKKTFFDTVAIRHKAVLKYGYRPSMRGVAIHIFQIMVIALLPEKLIYPLFKALVLPKQKLASIKLATSKWITEVVPA